VVEDFDWDIRGYLTQSTEGIYLLLECQISLSDVECCIMELIFVRPVIISRAAKLLREEEKKKGKLENAVANVDSQSVVPSLIADSNETVQVSALLVSIEAQVLHVRSCSPPEDYFDRMPSS
jgi:hypothetical protein